MRGGRKGTAKDNGVQPRRTFRAYSASSSPSISTKPYPWWPPVTRSFGMCTETERGETRRRGECRRKGRTKDGRARAAAALW